MSITFTSGQDPRIRATISLRFDWYSGMGTCWRAPSEVPSLAPKNTVQSFGATGPWSAITAERRSDVAMGGAWRGGGLTLRQDEQRPACVVSRKPQVTHLRTPVGSRVRVAQQRHPTCITSALTSQSGRGNGGVERDAARTARLQIKCRSRGAPHPWHGRAACTYGIRL